MKAATDYVCGYIPIKLLTKSNAGPDWARGPLFVDPCYKQTYNFCFRNCRFHTWSFIFPFLDLKLGEKNKETKQRKKW